MNIQIIFIIHLLIKIVFGESIAEIRCKEYVQKSKYLSYSGFGLSPLPLIINGDNVIEGEFPHMAVIGYQQSGSKQLHWACGGSLISDLFVITAAHCAFSLEYGIPKIVRIGSTSMNFEMHSQEERIVQILIHPERRGLYNDVALIRLEQPVKLNAHVRPACLNVRGQLENVTAIATGFGVTDFTSSSMNQRLMKTTLTIYSYNKCTAIYKDILEDELPEGILPSQLCAGNPQGNSDTCSGDSGGPLQIRLQESPYMYIIIGITSFGLFCGQNMPSFFSNISYYVPWIEEIVWK